MRNVDIEEYLAEDGSDVVVRTRHGMVFENGEQEMVLHVRGDNWPRLGQRVSCGGILVKVADKRFDAEGKRWVMDEDTRGWFPLTRKGAKR